MKIGKMSKEKEPGKRGRMAEWTVAAVIFLLVLFLLLSGRISVSVTEEAVTMKGTYWKKKTVPVGEIRSVSYREDFQTGKRAGGFGSWTLLMGRFRNEELGSYTLYAYTKAAGHVLMETDDGFFVFGLKDREELERLYGEISALVPEKDKR